VAWTSAALDAIAHGDIQRGAFVALNCTACHGDAGVSNSDIAPTLAGLDAAVIYKQLTDYGSGKRLSGAMNGIGQALSPQDAADVAVYYSRLPGGVPVLPGRSLPASGRTLREPGAATRLIFAGDPARGIAPCSACHGPGGYKVGAPALSRQRAAYIAAQSQAFSQGMRQNDINMQMRSIAREMTSEEMRGVAQFYGVGDVP
jgi:cytochrome c553